MNEQELYTKLRVKKEFAMDDVVTRLSFDEVDTLLKGLRLLGAKDELAEEAIEEIRNPLSPYEESRTWSTVQIKNPTSKHTEKGIVIHHKSGVLLKELEIAFPNRVTQLFSEDEVDFVERDVELEETIRNMKVISTYTWEGRQVRVLTGKHHYEIGQANVNVWKAKPIEVTFPSGEKSYYTSNQLSISSHEVEVFKEALLLQRSRDNKTYNRMIQNLKEHKK